MKLENSTATPPVATTILMVSTRLSLNGSVAWVPLDGPGSGASAGGPGRIHGKDRGKNDQKRRNH